MKVSQHLKWSAAALLAVFALAAQADPVTPEMQGAVDKYKSKLVEWAANPTIVAAVKESNAKGGLAPGMTNAKWDELGDKDPVVAGFQNSPAGKLVSKWEEDKNLGKLNVRDEKGNLVAASSSAKPLLYNNASRAPFANGLKGAWSANEAKPDPTTQRKSVQISAPVLDGGKAIGVLHSSYEQH